MKKYFILSILFFGLFPLTIFAATINFTTDYYSTTLADKTIADTDLTTTSCNSIAGIGASFCISSAFSTFPTYARNAYALGNLSNPITADTLIDDTVLASFPDGEYYILTTDNHTGTHDCTSLDIVTCTTAFRVSGTLGSVVKVCISASHTAMAEGACAAGGGPPPVDDFGTLITAALSNSTTTTGFDIEQTIHTVGQNQAKMWTGEILNIAYDYRYWFAISFIIIAVLQLTIRSRRIIRRL